MMPPTETADDTGWANLLQPGEGLLWQGHAMDGARPDLPVRFFDMLGTILSLGSLLFLVIAVLGRSQLDFVIGFGGIGAVVLIIGLTCKILPRRRQLARLKRSRYALTDQRMLIHDGSSLRAWPITPDLEIEVLRRPPGSVLIAPPEDPRRPNRPTREIGFIAIPEPDRIADLIKDIQMRRTGETEVLS